VIQFRLGAPEAAITALTLLEQARAEQDVSWILRAAGLFIVLATEHSRDYASAIRCGEEILPDVLLLDEPMSAALNDRACLFLNNLCNAYLRRAKEVGAHDPADAAALIAKAGPLLPRLRQRVIAWRRLGHHVPDPYGYTAQADTILKVMLASGDLDGARTWLRKVVWPFCHAHRSPRMFAEMQHMLAVIREAEGRPGKALRLWTQEAKALARTGEVARERESYEHLAHVQELLGQHEQALAAYKRMIELDQQLRSVAAENRAQWFTLESAAEKARREAEALLAHAAKMSALGRMVAAINHEIRNPLATVKLLAQSGREEVAAIPSAAKLFTEIDEIATGLATFASQIVEFSRKSAMTLESVELAPLIDQAIAIIAPRRRQVRATIDVQPLAAGVTADRYRAQTILVNLLDNALDAIAASSRREIRIECRLRAAQAEIAIIDSGPGLTPAAMPRLFESFFTTKPAGEGLGLGLWLSRQAAREMGGELHAANHAKGGAVFTLLLPAAGR
jgi:C4-dicarboxylate-specific signal transduction histidine kinase